MNPVGQLGFCHPQWASRKRDGVHMADFVGFNRCENYSKSMPGTVNTFEPEEPRWSFKDLKIPAHFLQFML